MARQLTDKQEKFAHLVVELGSQTEAYRRSYDAENMATKTITETASRLANDRNISARIQEIRDEVAERAIWKKLDSLKVLSDIAFHQDSQDKDKINAVKELNSMKGWQKQTVDNISSDGSMTPPAPTYKITDE